jgi:UPF0755 protein
VKRFLGGVITFTVVVALAAAVSVFLYLNGAPETEGKDVIFDLSPGPFLTVAKNLEEQGVITDAFRFKILARLTGYANRVRVGEYALRTDMPPMKVLKIISSGKSIMHPLTVVEGANIFDVADLIEKKGFGKKSAFMKLCRSSEVMKEFVGEPLSSCEGYLFPETYGITKFMDERAILKQMTDRFLQNFERIAESAKDFNLNRHQIVILASIIEKETGAPEERPIISSVYNNRLRQGMRLQADPTVLYGKWEKTGDYQLSITKHDLSTPNPYNTYTKAGLPFGPIANPGLEALKATIAPAQTEFLYFVSKNNGTHVFSKDYEGHNNAVKSFQQNAKARAGKSWRDLSKKKNDKATQSKKPPITSKTSKK